MLDFNAAYTVDGYRGIAFRLIGYAPMPQDAGDDDWGDFEPEDDETRVIAVMVGDDRRHVVDVEDVTVIPEDAYCAECGQMGCTADGRDRG